MLDLYEGKRKVPRGTICGNLFPDMRSMMNKPGRIGWKSTGNTIIIDPRSGWVLALEQYQRHHSDTKDDSGTALPF